MRSPPTPPDVVRVPTAVGWLSARVHYAWVIAVLGLATVFACLGIARFSLGMLLPSMRADLGLAYTVLGWISTANFVGYLTGAVGAGPVVARIGARTTVLAALVTIAVSLGVVAVAGGASVILPAYLITGVGSGMANVAVMGLVPHWFHRTTRGRASGIMVIGSGFALMGSGVLVPEITARWGPPGWRLGWAILAAVVLAVAVLEGLFLRNRPAELGLAPYGEQSPAVRMSGAGERASGRSPAGPARVLAHLGALYLVFGFTYVVYVTFIVETLVQRGFSERAAGWFWFAVGALSILSGPVFGALSDRAGRRVGLAAVFALHGTSYLLIGLALDPVGAILASVLLFGVSAWSIPGIMGAAVGDYLGPVQAVTAFGRLTVAFGAGQALGPVVAGAMAEASGGFSSAFLLTAGLAAGAALVSLALRPPAERDG
ncbi:MAG: YbfB/YjiJ family MFS transporter [Kineosporiaceae bacterium]|nr:YbfB/YjiJ family MFS transporter [Kineosporiaceae bacterium]